MDISVIYFSGVNRIKVSYSGDKCKAIDAEAEIFRAMSHEVGKTRGSELYEAVD